MSLAGYWIPGGMNKLQNLEELSVFINDGFVPKGFGPWPRMTRLEVSSSKKFPSDFEEQMKAYHPNADLVRVKVLRRFRREKDCCFIRLVIGEGVKQI